MSNADTATAGRKRRLAEMTAVEDEDREQVAADTGVPVQIQWLVEFLVKHALDKVSVAFLSLNAV